MARSLDFAAGDGEEVAEGGAEELVAGAPFAWLLGVGGVWAILLFFEGAGEDCVELSSARRFLTASNNTDM